MCRIRPSNSGAVTAESPHLPEGMSSPDLLISRWVEPVGLVWLREKAQTSVAALAIPATRQALR